MHIRYLSILAAVAALIGLMLWVTARTPAPMLPQSGGTLPSLPTNYRDVFEHYATVTRPDNRTRDIYISPNAADWVADNSTARLPNGTVVVIEEHPLRRNLSGEWVRGEMQNALHVAEKRADWQPQDYQSTERAGDWNYFSVDAQSGQLTQESVFECFDCHANNAHIDFLFSREALIAYGQTDILQESTCNRPARLPC